MFELSYPDEETARGALNRAIQKLPIKARVVAREEGY
jgi:large subunit ribosomal protein L16